MYCLQSYSRVISLVFFSNAVAKVLPASGPMLLFLRLVNERSRMRRICMAQIRHKHADSEKRILY